MTPSCPAARSLTRCGALRAGHPPSAYPSGRPGPAGAGRIDGVGKDVRMMLLVPADPLRPRRPDEHFAAEARAAREVGLDVAVVDHDALARGDDPTRAVSAVPSAGGPAVYRGWMLAAPRY